MSELSKEQLETIWRVLYGRTEFSYAKKVGLDIVQIPDPLPKSLAEVAEDIRCFLRDSVLTGDKHLATEYAMAMQGQAPSGLSHVDHVLWLLLLATPLDKITAAVKVWEKA